MLRKLVPGNLCLRQCFEAIETWTPVSQKTSVPLPLRWQFRMKHFPTKFAISKACLGVKWRIKLFDAWILEFCESVGRALHSTLSSPQFFSGRFCHNDKLHCIQHIAKKFDCWSEYSLLKILLCFGVVFCPVISGPPPGITAGNFPEVGFVLENS